MSEADKNGKPTATAIKRRYEVTERDLPLHCPTNTMPLWSAHPKVYLPIDAPEAKGRALCPYCGTEFVLVEPNAAT